MGGACVSWFMGEPSVDDAAGDGGKLSSGRFGVAFGSELRTRGDVVARSGLPSGDAALSFAPSPGTTRRWVLRVRGGNWESSFFSLLALAGASAGEEIGVVGFFLPKIVDHVRERSDEDAAVFSAGGSSARGGSGTGCMARVTGPFARATGGAPCCESKLWAKALCNDDDGGGPEGTGPTVAGTSGASAAVGLFGGVAGGGRVKC